MKSENSKNRTINYFDGVNSMVASNVAKREELFHAENARSNIIGAIEKREGMEVIGTATSGPFICTENLGLFYFYNEYNKGLYRLSTVDDVASIYYLNNSDVWTALEGLGTNLVPPDGIPNGIETGTLNKAGLNYVEGDILNVVQTGGVGGKVKVEVVSVAGAILDLSLETSGHSYSLAEDVAVSGGSGTGATVDIDSLLGIIRDVVSTCMAEGNLYFVNEGITPRYISGDDGTTVTNSATSSGNLYNCPKANLINYYKGRLYVADYMYGTPEKEYKNTVLFSSTQLGIIALVNEDTAIGETEIPVSDFTKYFNVGETVEFRRGNLTNYIATGTIASIGDTSITLTSGPAPYGGASNGIETGTLNNAGTGYTVGDILTVVQTGGSGGSVKVEVVDGSGSILDISLNASGTGYTVAAGLATTGGTGTSATIDVDSLVTSMALEAGDEIWVQNTFDGEKVFRWVHNPTEMGVNIKNYDSFKVSSTTDNDDERIKVMTNIGNVMFIATSNNIAIWNGTTLQNLDYGIGCASKRGHVKSGGLLYFLHYTGVFSTEGGAPEYKSAKVERYIRGATKENLDKAAAGKKGRNVFFCIGDVTLKNPDGSVDKTLPDVCLELNIDQSNWFIHTNWKMKHMVTYLSEEDPDLLVGISTFTDLPVVELLNAGSYLDVSSASSANIEIPFRIDTSNILLGSSFQLISYPTEVRVEMDRGMGLKCFVSLDMGDFYELEGEAGKGLTTFRVHGKAAGVNNPPRCRNIRLSLRHSNRQLCKISKLAIVTDVTEEEEKIKPDGK